MRKKAFITGGERGIGRGIALALAEEGYDVAFSYYEKEQIKARSGQSFAYQQTFPSQRLQRPSLTKL